MKTTQCRFLQPHCYGFQKSVLSIFEKLLPSLLSAEERRYCCKSFRTTLSKRNQERLWNWPLEDCHSTELRFHTTRYRSRPDTDTPCDKLNQWEHTENRRGPFAISIKKLKIEKIENLQSKKRAKKV